MAFEDLIRHGSLSCMLLIPLGGICTLLDGVGRKFAWVAAFIALHITWGAKEGGYLHYSGRAYQ
jgi:hypothetical protein